MKKRGTKAIRVSKSKAATLEEVGRFLADQRDEDVERPRTVALETLVQQFISQNRGHFAEKPHPEEEQDSHWVYRRRDDRPHSPASPENSKTDGGREDAAPTENSGGDDENSADGKLTFSMSDGPSSET